MSKPKELPFPIEQMIDRDEIREITGCTHNQIVYITKYRPNGFPAWCHRGANRKLWYRRDVMLEWLKHNDVHSLYAARTIIAEVQEKRLGFDNKAAVAFITRPPVNVDELSFSQLAMKHCREFGKTKTVHVPERNDVEIPHSGLSFFRSINSYNIAHEEWGY